jgi:type II secretory pathway component PulK
MNRFHRQSGIALIAVLWLTVLLTVIASGFAFSMRSEVL